jgi:hypothetical protein
MTINVITGILAPRPVDPLGGALLFPEIRARSTASSLPGVVIEPLYLTDPFEASIAASTTDQQIVAQGIATALGQFLVPPAKSRPFATRRR